MDSSGQNIGWRLWARWLLATLIGYVVGAGFAIVLTGTIGGIASLLGLFHPRETDLIVGLCVGAAIGLAQVIALRQILALNYGWVWGGLVGFGLPFTLDVLLDEGWLGAIEVPLAWLITVGIIAGALAGIIQTAALRRHTPRAGWWTWMSAASFGIASLCFFSLDDAGLGLIAGMLVVGVLSGAFLVWLVKD
jgi:hypothetical protein